MRFLFLGLSYCILIGCQSPFFQYNKTPIFTVKQKNNSLLLIFLEKWFRETIEESIACRSQRLKYVVYFIAWRVLYVRCTTIIFSSGSFSVVTPQRDFLPITQVFLFIINTLVCSGCDFLWLWLDFCLSMRANVNWLIMYTIGL